MKNHDDVKKDKWKELVQRLVGRGILQSPQVIQAIRRVPRENFLPMETRGHAAVDSPLPIGFGQTISAPLN